MMDAPHRPLRLASAKKLLNTINKEFGSLPFCRRYLDRVGETNYLLGVSCTSGPHSSRLRRLRPVPPSENVLGQNAPLLSPFANNVPPSPILPSLIAHLPSFSPSASFVTSSEKASCKLTPLWPTSKDA